MAIDREKMLKAIETYLKTRGYEIEAMEFGPVDAIAYDPEDDALAFIFVVEGMNAELTAEMRSYFEAAAMAYISENDLDSIRFRLDVIGMHVIGDNKAFVKHHINAGGYKED